VGQGLGSFDSTGNFVGTGDYALVLVVSPELDRFARTATSARAAWAFGVSEAWRGSRVEFTLEDEARRLGDGRFTDIFLSTGLALVDTTLSLGTIVQRLEAELAPGSRAAAFRARAERRVSADRTVSNFSQTTDQRSGALRWRSRPSPGTSAEVEARIDWQRAEQRISGGANFSRTLVDEGGTAQFIWQPSGTLRLVGAMDASWSRPVGQPEFTRTLRVGPDAGMSVGRGGRVELTVRRAFISGPPALGAAAERRPGGGRALGRHGALRLAAARDHDTGLELHRPGAAGPPHGDDRAGRSEGVLLMTRARGQLTFVLVATLLAAHGLAPAAQAAASAKLELRGWPLAMRDAEGWFAPALKAPGDSLALATALGRAELRLQSGGWLDARLSAQWSADSTRLSLTAEPGGRYRWGALALAVPPGDSARLASFIRWPRGEPADPTQLTTIIERALTAAESQGHAWAQLAVTGWDPDSGRVDVRLSGVLGPP
jgi:hypothetical protein